MSNSSSCTTNDLIYISILIKLSGAAGWEENQSNHLTFILLKCNFHSKVEGHFESSVKVRGIINTNVLICTQKL